MPGIFQKTYRETQLTLSDPDICNQDENFLITIVLVLSAARIMFAASQIHASGFCVLIWQTLLAFLFL